MNPADYFSKKYARTFPGMYEDLFQEGHLILLEEKEKGTDPGLLWRRVQWRLWDYAMESQGKTREACSDALEWLSVSEEGRLEAIGMVDDLLTANLSRDSKEIISRVLNRELIRESGNWKPSMRQIRDSLCMEGWKRTRAEKALNEIRKWWRNYDVA